MELTDVDEIREYVKNKGYNERHWMNDVLRCLEHCERGEARVICFNESDKASAHDKHLMIRLLFGGNKEESPWFLV